MKPKIKVKRGPTGLFRFVLAGRNGEIIATSEHYKTEAKARKGILALLSACTDTGIQIE